MQTITIPLEFPATTINARPLPENPPPSFQGAVGNFSMSILPTPIETDFNTPITIQAQISGTGNIDQFPGPQIINPQQTWKHFDMIAAPVGSERRSSTATLNFSQVIRPLKLTTQIPTYQFSFFDPLLEQYRTLTSPTRPITITGTPPSSDNPPITTTPMISTNLPLLAPSNRPLKTFSSSKLPPWLWHLLPASIAALLLGLFVKNRLAILNAQKQPARQFASELSHLESIAHDQKDFLITANNLAIKYRATGPEFTQLQKHRDEICFRPDQTSTPIPQDKKNKILQLLKTLAPLFILALILLHPPPLQATQPNPPTAKNLSFARTPPQSFRSRKPTR